MVYLLITRVLLLNKRDKEVKKVSFKRVILKFFVYVVLLFLTVKIIGSLLSAPLVLLVFFMLPIIVSFTVLTILGKGMKYFVNTKNQGATMQQDAFKLTDKKEALFRIIIDDVLETAINTKESMLEVLSETYGLEYGEKLYRLFFNR